MRYIAKVLKNSLHEKFPDASEDELMKVEALKYNIRICIFPFTEQYVQVLLIQSSLHDYFHHLTIMSMMR